MTTKKARKAPTTTIVDYRELEPGLLTPDPGAMSTLARRVGPVEATRVLRLAHEILHQHPRALEVVLSAAEGDSHRMRARTHAYEDLITEDHDKE